MENTKEEKAIMTKKGAELYAECIADYVLPDYKGDVKRIMHTEARAIPTGKFIGEDSCEFSGSVIFDVVYVSAENKLESVSFTADYSVGADAPQDAAEVFATAACEGVNVRLTGPRKVSARCRAVTSVYVDTALSVNAVGTTLDEENLPELSLRDINVGRVLVGELKDVGYTTEVLFAMGAVLDDVSISAERACVHVTNATAGDGEVTLFGEIEISCVMTRADSAPRRESVMLPFEERIEVSGALDVMIARGMGAVESLKITAIPADDGVHVSADVAVRYSAYALCNSATEAVKDAYSKIYDTENKYKTTDYREIVDAKRTSSKVSREIAKKETDAPLAVDIVYLSAIPEIESVRIESSEVKIEGEIRFSGVACEISDDASAVYSSLRIGVPFSEKVNYNSQIPKNATVECSVDVTNARMDLDSENFYLEAGISVDTVLALKQEIDTLDSSDIIEGTKAEPSASVINIYYPEEGDTLFEVAKRFKTSPRQIAEDNSLTKEAVSATGKDALSSVRKLLIRKS